MNTPTTDRKKIGEIRPSQLLYNYGVGAVVELPNLSVMVMGLDDWPIEQVVTEISEPRLLRAVQHELGPQVAKLLTPPVSTDSAGVMASPFDDTANVGVPVAPFPRWQVCPYVLEKVVLAERLREVRALIGFTRIECPGDYTEIEDFPREQRAPLGRTKLKWVPTSEVRGEGVFLQFSEQAIESWIKKTKKRESEFFEAHRRWRMNRGLEPNDGFPSIRYVLLHSLAHALIRQFAIECGYTTASIRERIYCSPPQGGHEPMAGILLYTAAPDSEGTLGGLVALGDPKALGRHLDQSLEALRLCASDPLCAEHHPIKDGLTMHGAACHACLFLPETSCERGNKYLDRTMLVSTVESGELAFFAEFAEDLPQATITAETDESVTPPKPVETNLSETDALLEA